MRADPSVPFQMPRKQFPVEVAFSMAINKAQYETFEKAGLNLRAPCLFAWLCGFFLLSGAFWIFMFLLEGHFVKNVLLNIIL